MDPKATACLNKHWPAVPVFPDVCTLTAEQVGPVDVITGGFPCQDVSIARTGSGLPLGDALRGSRSGLWKEYLRLIDTLKPKWVIAENVSALVNRGLEEILDDLNQIGYDAEWHCIDAAYVGAPHRRDRCWVIAYPRSSGLSGPVLEGDALSKSTRSEGAQLGNLAVRFGREWRGDPGDIRVGDGLPFGSHRLKQLGNAVVPAIPEIIGKAIMRKEAELDER